MSIGSATVPGYDLELPTGEHVVQTLSRLNGIEKAQEIWADACRAAGVPPQVRLPIGQLKAVALQLKAQPGIVAVTGGSLLVRIQSYELLSNKAGV